MARSKTATRFTYKVVFEQEGSGWRASIPEIRGVEAWGRSLSEARRKVRKSLSGSPVKNAASVARKAELLDEVKLPGQAKKELERYAEARARAQAEVSALRQSTRSVVDTLTRKFGISLRDASALLGLSRERVRQLTI
jgi:hypothetical protein